MVATSIINIDSVAEYLGEEKSSALIGLHSVSGCDTTGKVYRKGKQRWVKAFLASSKDVIDSLNILASNEYSELSMPGIEKLFISVFCPQTKIKTISHGRWYLFKKNNADCEKLLPTTGALLQHVKRAKLQAMIWGELLTII